MKKRYLAWRCECGRSNTKGTNIDENPIECRGRCQCKRNVRNVYRHIERLSNAEGFTTRAECRRFCEGLNADRAEVIA